MRYDVVNLILGWTLLALTVPLLVCAALTWWLDGLTLAIQAFGPAIAASAGIGTLLSRSLHAPIHRNVFEIWKPSWELAWFGR